MVELNRRTFLAAGAAAGTRLLGANERIRCALIGAGGRGAYLIGKFREQGAEVAAVCDVYEPHLTAGLAAASPNARACFDYRRLLEDPAVDAVIVATPDHWHARMAIDAVEAGKDVYLEKPMAHTIAEGYSIVEAARRTRRVVQVGTQRRSFPINHEARQIVGSGALGQVRLVTAWWLNTWKSLSTSELKGKLHWDLFLGPAPKRDLDPRRYFNWLFFWDYSGGLMVGQGAHVMDSIHWMMDLPAPRAVTCTGSRPNLEGAEVPETTCLTAEYSDNCFVVFTVGYKAMHYNFSQDQLQQYHGSAARFDLGRETYALYPQSEALDAKPSRERREPGTFDSASTAHVRNFLDCVKTRQDPNATVEMGQAANIVLGLAMESLRTGRRVQWNTDTRTPA
jgi:predicted dehydrogenase